MLNLTELDQSVLISVAVGFLGGVLSGAADDVSEFFIRDRRVDIGNTVRKYVLSGATMGIFLGVMIFAVASISTTPIQELTRIAIASSIALVISPVLVKVISSRFFSQR